MGQTHYKGLPSNSKAVKNHYVSALIAFADSHTFSSDINLLDKGSLENFLQGHAEKLLGSVG